MSTYNPETKRILIKNKFPVSDILLRKCVFGDRPIFLDTKPSLKMKGWIPMSFQLLRTISSKDICTVIPVPMIEAGAC